MHTAKNGCMKALARDLFTSGLLFVVCGVMAGVRGPMFRGERAAARSGVVHAVARGWVVCELGVEPLQ